MTDPTIKSIAEVAMKLILQSMLDVEDDRPLAAERNVAKAIIILNQLANIESFTSPEINEQFLHCRYIILGK